MVISPRDNFFSSAFFQIEENSAAPFVSYWSAIAQL
jgi:hypothetical protein